MYAVRTDDLINPRPRASGGPVNPGMTYHFESGPNGSGEFFTDQTVFDMSTVLRGPVANGEYISIYSVRFDNTEWMKNQIKSLEDKGLA